MADTLTLTLDMQSGETGDVVIKMRPDLAPAHCAQISRLVGEGFYDGLTWRLLYGPLTKPKFCQ